jgi:predicted DCC family thiol-disulfide oxidoreductase YuxK
MTPPPPAIVLYDSDCGLCQALMIWLRRRDKRARLHLHALGSSDAARIFQEAGHTPPDEDSMVLIYEGRVHLRSTAALLAGAALGGPWILLKIFLIIPTSWRDALYRWVARNRQRWFK